jgi:hypothetical protein
VRAAALAATAGLAVGVGIGHVWGAASPPAPPASATLASTAPREAQAPPLPLPVGASTSSPSAVRVEELPSITPAAPAAAAPPSADRAGLPSRSALRREREWVDGAVGALRNGHPREALDLAEQHARQFPAGQLAEEREVVAIEALLALGRTDEARTRTARFRARFPESPEGARLTAKENRTGP